MGGVELGDNLYTKALNMYVNLLNTNNKYILG